VVDQKISMDEALYATITAVVPEGVETIPSEPGGLEFVWATNDPDLKARENFVGGKFQMPRDDVSAVLKDVTIRINEKALEEVGSLVEQIEANTQEVKELLFATDDKSAARLDELSEENKNLENQVRKALQTIANDELNSIPEFNLQNLKENYIFYMPITYRKPKELFYYRGLVRLGVSAEKIIQIVRETRKSLLINSVIFSLGAIGLGILGALLLASITVNPIKKLVSGVATIRDTADKEQLKSHVIQIKQKDELRILADTVNEMTQGLVAAAVAAKDLTLGKEIQKMFIPLDKDARGQKVTTGGEKTDKVEIFGYYEGAKGVSGDYFEYKKLDAQHYAVIKCDVAGKGVPAALIMVEVATIFLTYFRNWNIKSPGFKIDGLAYMMNDMLEERGFQGRFAALIIGIINVETGAGYFCNAGDNIVYIYDSLQKKMIRKVLPETPAAGVFPSMLLETKSGFVTVPIKLNKGDTLLLYTDGVFEAQRLLRGENYKTLSWKDIADKGWDLSTDQGTEAAAFEELSEERMDQIQNAVFNRRVYKLTKYQNPNSEEELTFDFAGCMGSVEEAVLAMVSVEKIFRIYPDPAAAPEDTVRVDRRIDAFLDKHFVQYSLYFTNRIDRDEDSPYVSFGNLKEDSQYDDLTILGIKIL
jgi:serine phosphatase RsbU (regulator of sigma subunit)